MSAADKAAKAQGRSSKSLEKQTKKATQQYEQQQTKVAKRLNELDPTKKFQDWSMLGTQDIFETIPGKILKHKKGKNKGKPMRDASGNVLRAPSTTVLKQKGSPSATLEAIQAANQITANTLQQLEEIVPGSAQARAQAMQSIAQWENKLNQQYEGLQANQGLINQQRGVVESMLRGELTPVQQQQISRTIAERAGAGFNPATAGRAGGFQTAQAGLADQLRQSAEQRIIAGMQFAPGVNEQQRGLAASTIGLSEGFRGLQATSQNWQQLANSFVQNVPQMMGISLAGRGQNLDVQRMGIDIQKTIADMNLQGLNAATGQAQTTYGARQATAQADYARGQATAQGISDVGGALSSGIGAAGGAYNQYATAKASGIPQYSSLASAQQAAPYAGGYSQIQGMGYVPRATAV